MKTIVCNINDHSYKINIGDCNNDILSFIKKYNKAIVITDKNVDKIYLDEINSFSDYKFTIEPGEESKYLGTVEKIIESMLDYKFTRNDLVISFGGGVVGDIAGFVSSIYMRGIDFIQIPTTLISQVDSSVGGKTGVNFYNRKNIIGTFNQPKKVFIDTKYLNTLTRRDYNSGMAEVIKYASIKDKSIFDLIDKEDIDEIIYRCIKIKNDIVMLDQYDKGERMILNFGHTIGHAIEAYFDYNKYTHGEAVAIGMSVISNNKKIIEYLKKYDLPTELTVPYEDIEQYIENDKKSEGIHINLILLKSLGESYIKKIDIKNMKDYIGE